MATVRCPKCLGEGIIRAFLHVQGGVCFRCSGTGLVLESPEDKDESCDLILSLIKRFEGGGVGFIQCYVWNTDTTKRYYGTGHCSGFTIRNGVRVDIHTAYHVPLEDVRAEYRKYVADGYEIIPFEDFDSVYDAEVAPLRDDED